MVEKDNTKPEENTVNQENTKEDSDGVIVDIFKKLLDFYNRQNVTKKDF